MKLFRSLGTTLRILWVTHTNVVSYRFLLDAPVALFVRHIIAFYFVFALASTASFHYLVRDQWRNTAVKAWDELVGAWPENLQATYQDGRLSLTPSEPITLSYPSAFERPEGLPTHLAFIDTRAETASESPALLLASTTQLTIQRNGSRSSTAWNEILPPQDFTLSRTSLGENTEQAHAFIDDLLDAATLGRFLLSALAVPLLRLLLLVPFAWLSLGLLQLTGNRLTWGRTYRLGLLLLPVAETTQFLLSTLYPASNLHVFWWLWLLFLGVVSSINRQQL